MQIAWNGKEFDSYSEPKFFNSLSEVAKEIERKRMIYVGMSYLIGIKKK